METALLKMNDASQRNEETFSKSMSAVNYTGTMFRQNIGLSELSLLLKEVNIHIKKLSEIDGLGDHSGELIESLEKHLEGYQASTKGSLTIVQI